MSEYDDSISARDDPSGINQIVIVSHNVHKANINIEIHLATNPHNAHILLFQEIGYYPGKTIASMASKDGVVEVALPRNPEWKRIQQIHKYNEGPYPSVAMYVHKSIWHMNPKLRTDISTHLDFMAVTLMDPDGVRKLTVGNVYNRAGSFEFMDYLRDQSGKVGEVDVLMGDFNLHHDIWERDMTDRPNYELALDLLAAANVYSWNVLNDVDHHGPTRYPDQVESEGNRPSTLDLAFVYEEMIDVVDLIIAPKKDRMRSDHVPIILQINRYKGDEMEDTPETPYISKDGDDYREYIDEIIDIFEDLNKSTKARIDSGESPTASEVTRLLEKGISLAYKHNAKTPSQRVEEGQEQAAFSQHGWWNKECRIAIKRYNRTHKKEDYNAFRREMRAAKQAFFQRKMQNMVKKRRPWDLINWTKPNTNPDYVGITNKKGEYCNTKEKTWRA